MNLPYLLVMTTYPGASPEQVEADVTQPLENALSVLNGVKNVTTGCPQWWRSGSRNAP